MAESRSHAIVQFEVGTGGGADCLRVAGLSHLNYQSVRLRRRLLHTEEVELTRVCASRSDRIRDRCRRRDFRSVQARRRLSSLQMQSSSSRCRTASLLYAFGGIALVLIFEFAPAWQTPRWRRRSRCAATRLASSVDRCPPTCRLHLLLQRPSPSSLLPPLPSPSRSRLRKVTA